MTKIIVIGDNNKVGTERIQLIKCLQTINDNFIKNTTDPNNFEIIELICKEYTTEGEDLMFCYKKDRNKDGCLFLGHFNDGIV